MTHEFTSHAEDPEKPDETGPSPGPDPAEPRHMAIATTPVSLGADHAMSVFGGSSSFELAQRMAKLLSNSTLVPEPYQQYVLSKNNAWEHNPVAIGNCTIALEIASRLRLSPLMVMQNLDVVKGRPGFRGAFVAALVNNSPLFSRLRYEFKGEPGAADYGCRAYATEKETRDVLYGTWITWAMVTGEGWDKNPKWKTMRDQMFMYRAATFWSRVHSPDLLLGMPTADEIEDVLQAIEHRGSVTTLNQRLEAGGESASPKQDDDKPAETEKPARQRRQRAAPAAAPLEQAEPAATPAPDASADSAGEAQPETVAAAPAPAPAPPASFDVE